MLPRSPTTTPLAPGAAVAASRARAWLRAWSTTSWPAWMSWRPASRPSPCEEPVIRTRAIGSPFAGVAGVTMATAGKGRRAGSAERTAADALTGADHLARAAVQDRGQIQPALLVGT